MHDHALYIVITRDVSSSFQDSPIAVDRSYKGQCRKTGCVLLRRKKELQLRQISRMWKQSEKFVRDHKDSDRDKRDKSLFRVVLLVTA